jgi:hypothetical protein
VCVCVCVCVCACVCVCVRACVCVMCVHVRVPVCWKPISDYSLAMSMTWRMSFIFHMCQLYRPAFSLLQVSSKDSFHFCSTYKLPFTTRKTSKNILNLFLKVFSYLKLFISHPPWVYSRACSGLSIAKYGETKASGYLDDVRSRVLDNDYQIGKWW